MGLITYNPVFLQGAAGDRSVPPRETAKPLKPQAGLSRFRILGLLAVRPFRASRVFRDFRVLEIFVLFVFAKNKQTHLSPQPSTTGAPTLQVFPQA